MNRFEQDTVSTARKIFIWIPILLFAVIFILFLGGIRSVSEVTYTKQQESLETAITRGIAQCYAVEGMYPPDIQYLREHYGLTFDETEFLVDYEVYGSNLMPEFTVLRKHHDKIGR